MSHQAAPLLTVQELRVDFPGPGGVVAAVRGISFSLGRERLGIVGESGSGKSVTGRALLGLVPAPGRVVAKRLRFDTVDLLTASQQTWRGLRGQRIAMVMQDPKFSLNPVMPVGRQMIEGLRLPRRVARERALSLLEAVQIRDPRRVFRAYPFELSGGMGQRVMIAMMLMGEPDLLIADEPTSALDVTVQEEVLSILDGLVRSRGMGLIFISHDLPLVAKFCDRIVVMYRGQVMETLAADRLYEAQHPYTQGLLNCLPRLGAAPGPLATLERDAAWEAAQ